METREENLLHILATLRAQGIRYKLINGIFKFDTTTIKDEDLKTALDVCRPGLSMILRAKEGLCIYCGQSKAVRPQREPDACEKCYWAKVTPIHERLQQSAATQKRIAKARNAGEHPKQAEEEQDEQCLSLE